MQALRMAAVPATLLLPGLLAAQQAPVSRSVVAVLPVVLPAEAGAGFGHDWHARLTAAFQAQPAVEVVSAARVERAGQQFGLAGGDASEESAVRMGRQLGARYIVIARLTGQRDRTQLEIHALDVATGVRSGLPVRASGRADELAPRLRELAATLSQQFELEADAQADRRIPVEASMAYTRGLDYEKRGQKDVAARLFERALQLYPRHDQARSALDRLRSGGRQ